MKNFNRYIAGFKHFRKEYFKEAKSFYASLQDGQHPELMVIACSDSRADPAMLIGAEPGDIFVVRNIANIVPHESQMHGKTAVMAAVEYAVKHLHIEHLVILGHSNCGGIYGLMHQDTIANDEYILEWVRTAEPALRRLQPELQGELGEIRRRHVEKAGILLSAENLLSYNWLRYAVNEGTLHIHCWYFDLARGTLSAYDASIERFVPINHWDQDVLPQNLAKEGHDHYHLRIGSPHR